MMNIFKIVVLLFFYSNSSAQVQYSSRLTKTEIETFNSLKKQLLSLPFPAALKIANDTSFSKKEFEIYNPIFNSVIDTTKINETYKKMGGYKLSISDQVQRITLGALVGMHTMLRCAKDSLFFVMPANEYHLANADSGILLPQYYENVYLGGITGGGFYYPAYQFMLSKKRDKIYFIDFLVNFDGGNGSAKSEYFDKALEPLLNPCQRTYINHESVQPAKATIPTVDK